LFNISLRATIELAEDVNFVLETLMLIQWHMIMHFDLSEKTVLKYKKMLGEKIWRDLELLHEADCEAR
jgi:hypothetical protein